MAQQRPACRKFPTEIGEYVFQLYDGGFEIEVRNGNQVNVTDLCYQCPYRFEKVGGNCRQILNEKLGDDRFMIYCFVNPEMRKRYLSEQQKRSDEA